MKIVKKAVATIAIIKSIVNENVYHTFSALAFKLAETNSFGLKIRVVSVTNNVIDHIAPIIDRILSRSA